MADETKYVDLTDGSDLADGLTPSTPWKTITKAIDSHTSDGIITINVKGSGTDSLVFDNGGGKHNGLTFVIQPWAPATGYTVTGAGGNGLAIFTAVTTGSVSFTGLTYTYGTTGAAVTYNDGQGMNLTFTNCALTAANSGTDSAIIRCISNTSGTPARDITFVGDGTAASKLIARYAFLRGDDFGVVTVSDYLMELNGTGASGFFLNLDTDGKIEALIFDGFDVTHDTKYFTQAMRNVTTAGLYDIGKFIWKNSIIKFGQGPLFDRGMGYFVFENNTLTAVTGTALSLGTAYNATVATPLPWPQKDVPILSTLAASGASTTEFTTDAGNAANDYYNNYVCEVIDATDGTTERRLVLDYVTATKTFTLAAALSFTPADGDPVRVYPVPIGLVRVVGNTITIGAPSGGVTVMAEDAEVSGNVITGTNHVLNIDHRGIHVFNNIVTGGFCLTLYGTGCHVHNNTFYSNSTSNAVFLGMTSSVDNTYDLNQYGKNHFFYNNIIINTSTGTCIDDYEGAKGTSDRARGYHHGADPITYPEDDKMADYIDYNCYYSAGQYFSKINKIGRATILAAQGAWSGWNELYGDVNDQHSIEADPLFMNAAGGDFRLRSGSPCLNSGKPTANDGSTNMGAYSPRYRPEYRPQIIAPQRTY